MTRLNWLLTGATVLLVSAAFSAPILRANQANMECQSESCTPSSETSDDVCETEE